MNAVVSALRGDLELLVPAVHGPEEFGQDGLAAESIERQNARLLIGVFSVDREQRLHNDVPRAADIGSGRELRMFMLNLVLFNRNHFVQISRKGHVFLT